MSLRARIGLVSIALAVLPLAVVSWTGIRYFRHDKEGFVTLLGSEVTPVVAAEVQADVARLAERLRAMAELAPAGGRRADAAAVAARALGHGDLLAARLYRGGQTLATLTDKDALPTGHARELVMGALALPRTLPDPGAVRVDNVTRVEGTPVARVTLRLGGGLVAVGLAPPRRILPVAAASTFDTYVVGTDGRVLVASDPSLVAARTDVSDLRPVKALRRGQVGASRYQALDGTSVLGSYAPVRLAGLGVVQQLPASAVFGAVTALVRSAAITVGVVLLLAVLAALLVSRGVTRPVAQLASSARAIGRGRLDVEVPTLRGGEMGELADAFRAMQTGLAERDQRLKGAQAALVQSEKLGALGQLAAGITHEVKNPMAGIIGFAQLARKLTPDTSPAAPHLEMIEKEAKRAKAILDNLLSFSRQGPVEMVPLHPNQVVVETVKLVAHQLQINKVQLVTDYAEGLPPIRGSLNQLEQVLMNLMMNGMQAMQPKGGRLEVRTSLGRGGMVVVEVRDEGHGIKEEDRGRLFTPFFSTKHKGAGTGLGLSVSYGIVKQHGGEVRVWSQAGVGTAFYVDLPAAPGAGGTGDAAA